MASLHAPDIHCGGSAKKYRLLVAEGKIEDQATRYCLDVIAGRIPAGKLVRQSCQRHLTDLEKGPSRGLAWHLDQSEYVIRYFRFLKHTKGEWRGQPVVLAPWQAFTVGAVFGWKHAATGLRRFVKAYEEVPKKNGKSTKLAGIGLYGLIADSEPGAEVYAIATKKDQARIIFGEAREMVRQSEALRNRLRSFQLNISDEATYSKFEPLSSDDKSADGLNPSMALADELHRHKKPDLLNLFDNAMGSRRQGLLWIITTAGDDRTGTPYDVEHNYARKVLEGSLKDDSYFAYIACADEEDDWRLPATHAKANPNYGVSVKPADMERLVLKAQQSPDALREFKRFRLNVRQADAAQAISSEVWMRNMGDTRPSRDSLKGRTCITGVDLAATTDIAAKINLFPPVEEGERWKILAEFWTPEATLLEREAKDRAPYSRWVADGLLQACDGNRIRQDDIYAALVQDGQDFHVREITFDRWHAEVLEADLQEDGFLVTEFPQGFASYTHPTQEFLAMLLDGAFDHGGNEVLTWMASNLTLRTDTNENKMPAKGRSRGRIDGIVALIMALGRAIAPEPDAVDMAELIRSGQAIL